MYGKLNIRYIWTVDFGPDSKYKMTLYSFNGVADWTCAPPCNFCTEHGYMSKGYTILFEAVNEELHDYEVMDELNICPEDMAQVWLIPDFHITGTPEPKQLKGRDMNEPDPGDEPCGY
jgi:hypothetical protein